MTSPTNTLRHRALVGVLWSGLGNYGSSAVRLLATLVLAALLPPTDFGLFGMALMVIVLGEGVGELGIVSALVQQQDPGKKDLDSAFWLNMGLHLLLALGTFASADLITSFFRKPEGAPLLRLLALVFLINALAIVPKAVLIGSMRFRQITLALMASEVAFAVVGITMAVFDFGAWSLGGAVLAQRIVNTTFLFGGIEWRPGLALDFPALRRLVQFGAPMMGGTLLERGLVNADYFVIGRFMSLEELGYYTMAYQLALVPLDRLVGIMRRVTFPAFSRVQKDLDRVARGVIEGLKHLVAAALPIVMSIVVLGPWLLEGIYGEKWVPTIPSLRILGIGGIFLAPRVVEAALLAIGKPRLRLGLLALRFIAFVALVATVGLRYGIAGVAVSVSGAIAVWALATLVAGKRAFHFFWSDLAATLAPVARAGFFALSPLVVFFFIPPDRVSPWAALVYAGVAMNLVYLRLIFPLYRETIGTQLQSIPGASRLLSYGARKGRTGSPRD